MKGLKTIILLYLCFVPLSTHCIGSYNLHFSQISTKDGLSQNTVRAVLEDKKGFIWAGTLDGLNRYDGYKIHSYKPQLGIKHTLIDHRIKDIFQDKNGYLWIKTYKNEFSCYNPVTDSFVNYMPDETNATKNVYSNYYNSQNGDIWLWGNSNGCLRVTSNNGNFKVTRFLSDIIVPNKTNCKFIFEDSKSNFWVGGQSGLYSIQNDKTLIFYQGKYSFTQAIEVNNKVYFSTEDASIIEYDLKYKSFQEIKLLKHDESFLNIAKLSNNELLVITKQSGILSYNINTKQVEKPLWGEDPKLQSNIEFLIDKNGGIWLYNHTGNMWYYNTLTQKVKKMELIPQDIIRIIDMERYNVLIDSRNLIWITTYGNGLFCYNPENEVLENYKYNDNQNSPASDYLLTISEDKYGSIWIGSEYAGIIKVARSNYNTKIIRPEVETSIGKNNNVRTIYCDELNNVWLGTKNGSLYVYDKDLTNTKYVYKDINPYTLVEDDRNRIWVGTKGNGLYLIDRESMKEVQHITPNLSEANSLSHNSIFSILKDTKKRIWVGTFGGGINLLDETLNSITFKHFFFNEGNRSYIRYLYQDSKGIIWACSSDGIIKFDPDALITNPKAFSVYKMNLSDENSLNCNDIKTIYEDHEGTIWIGTAGGGLNKYMPALKGKPEHFIAYTKENGLSGDFVSAIMEDKVGNLWISTESGITKYDKKNNSFMVYQFSDKTYGNHFNENASIFLQDGNMLWGSLDGLLVFNPETFVADKNLLPVILTNFSIHGQTVRAGEKGSPLKYSISYSEKIELNYKQNTFTIEFATLDLKDPTKNKYVYMLENYDKQWSMISRQNMVTYKNLPPGKYIFKVKGTNSDGVWNEEETRIEITITPPFWKSWYAYSVYAILIALFVYMVIRIIIKFNDLNNNVKVEKELTNFKLRFFTNISHEFRTPLTLIRGAIENLNDFPDTAPKVKRQLEVLNRNSTILTRLIDQLLEFRKIQNNVLRLDLEEADIVSFSHELFDGFQEIALLKNINYIFTSNEEHFALYIDRRKLDKILYNLLSNAFKFTPKGGHIELSITINNSTQTCKISVIDNGLGVDKEKQHLLFSRFMQINFSSSGTGVGLSLVQEFVDVHKGKIWYESNGEQGSIFNVEISTNKEIYKGENFVSGICSDILPDNNRVMYPSDKTDDIQLPEISDSTLSNYKMLIIDDNDDIRNFLTDEFSKYFLVDMAEDGKIGLQKAIETNPDLIICDVMMPEMNGFEVTRQLKEDFQTCHIPVILLTAHSSIEHQVEGLKSGADAYVMKPFSLKYLVARVFNLIEQREQLKKRFSSENVLDGSLISIVDKDKEFYNMIDKILEEHIDDAEFTVDKFAELAKQRRTLFYKKIKGITGLSPNELIKVKRLRKAAEYLIQGDLTVSEVSYKVGFEDPLYFSKCFKAQYNSSPSKYGKSTITNNNLT